MSQEQRERRIGLRTKLNVMLIACILLVSVGLMTIAYRVYCRKVDSFYFDQARRAVTVAAEDYTSCQYVEHLWDMINTDEFRALRERAVAANDDQIIRDWMLQKPSAGYVQRHQSDGTTPDNGKKEYYEESDPLLSDYQFVAILLARIKELFEITSVYIQYDDDGTTSCWSSARRRNPSPPCPNTWETCASRPRSASTGATGSVPPASPSCTFRKRRNGSSESPVWTST